MKNYSLYQLRDTLKQSVESIDHLGSDGLTGRQGRCVSDIQDAVARICRAIDEYDHLCDRSRKTGDDLDPRSYLMYAARTPLQMIYLSLYLMEIGHQRQEEPIAPAYRDQFRRLEESGRWLVIRLERLWDEMIREQHQAQLRSSSGKGRDFDG